MKSFGPSEALRDQGKHDRAARCPFCQGSDTELYSLFGSQLSTSQYYCRDCRTVFERIKWESPEASPRGGSTPTPLRR